MYFIIGFHFIKIKHEPHQSKKNNPAQLTQFRESRAKMTKKPIFDSKYQIFSAYNSFIFSIS